MTLQVNIYCVKVGNNGGTSYNLAAGSMQHCSRLVRVGPHTEHISVWFWFWFVIVTNIWYFGLHVLAWQTKNTAKENILWLFLKFCLNHHILLTFNYFQLDSALQKIYNYLQRFAVGLEEVVMDQAIFNGDFIQEFNEAEYKLKAVGFKFLFLFNLFR